MRGNGGVRRRSVITNSTRPTIFSPVAATGDRDGVGRRGGGWEQEELDPGLRVPDGTLPLVRSGWLVLQAPVLKKLPGGLSGVTACLLLGVASVPSHRRLRQARHQAWVFTSGGRLFTILSTPRKHAEINILLAGKSKRNDMGA
ncbi:hypothetical protein HPP92_029120 [Vanilla planifolia]|uniref:Uncharacterized protein n=1 Tax=Vanilla planifolia TaxID=51239 RepID=A0A835U4J7_VANPL|nr:hypothetical protein HPP92_029120 [Vanilla planifolia]KAG0445893.1 hypothetical protein HPP92_029108 [Vanilla planifolia]